MVRGPKKHLKRLNAPKHWLLDKLGGIFVSMAEDGTALDNISGRRALADGKYHLMAAAMGQHAAPGSLAKRPMDARYLELI